MPTIQKMLKIRRSVTGRLQIVQVLIIGILLALSRYVQIAEVADDIED